MTDQDVGHIVALTIDIDEFRNSSLSPREIAIQFSKLVELGEKGCIGGNVVTVTEPLGADHPAICAVSRFGVVRIDLTVLETDPELASRLCALADAHRGKLGLASTVTAQAASA